MKKYLLYNWKEVVWSSFGGWKLAHHLLSDKEAASVTISRIYNIPVVWCCFFVPWLLLGKRRNWWISSLQEMDFQNNFWYKTLIDSSHWNRNSLCKRCLSLAILTRAEVCCVQAVRRCEIRGLERPLPIVSALYDWNWEDYIAQFPCPSLGIKSASGSLAESVMNVKFFKNIEKWNYIRKCI